MILWPDTFNNYFHPEVAEAGVEVLEAAGYQVLVPKQALCCGRPLYDWGMLNVAKRKLQQILEALQPQIAAGIPVVVLEPSCTAVFRDELTNLFPHDPNAQRLRQQTFTLGEFIDKRASLRQASLLTQAKDFELPQLKRKALVHGHCHHKAIIRTDSEKAVLAKLGLDFRILDSGCCGMAGAFGFEKGERYRVSR